MHEITPENIASIARRLYDAAQVAGGLPAGTPVPSMSPPLAAATIAPAEIPPIPPAPLTAVPLIPSLPSVPHSAAPSLNRLPELPFPSSSAQVPPAFPAAPNLANPSVETAGTTAPPADGLRAFVARLRESNLNRRPGECRPAWDDDISSRRWTGQLAHPVGPRAFDVVSIRRDFPALDQEVHGKPLVWLDNAATTQKPQAVIDAIAQYYARDNSNIHRAAHTLAARSTDAFEGARQKVQQFLGASSTQEIVFVRGTTEGINLIAQTYGRKFLQPGDEIVLSTLEHHANIVPWQMVAKEKGAVIRVIPVNDQGEVMLEHYQSLLGPRTRLVSLTHASNSLGTILPIAEMTQMARRLGARVLIDGAQSVAHIPVNVQQLDCDFFVFSGHKIFGPTGIGAVYAKRELLEVMPPWQGGGNMIRQVTFEETTYSEPPAKFEAGTPNIADAVGLAAALDYVQRLGLENIGQYEHELLQYATESLRRINGLRLIGTAREKVGVLSLVLAGRRPEEVGKLLDLEGIAVRAGHHCAQPSLRRFGLDATVRPSLAFYNTKQEVDRLADALRRIIQQ